MATLDADGDVFYSIGTVDVKAVHLRLRAESDRFLIVDVRDNTVIGDTCIALEGVEMEEA